jgi:Cu-Zn family superoxide dismutase
MLRRPLILAAAAALPFAGVFATSAFADDGPAYTGPSVKTVTATLRNAEGAEIGSVQLNQDASGVVQIRVNASNLVAGEHGIHLHAVGKCEGPAFTSAGGHFNPGNKQHGLSNPAGPHAGDLPGLTVGANGTASYTATTKAVTLLAGSNSLFDADGSAIVIHAAADDQMTDPAGNSGARVACAVLAEPAPASAPAPGAPNTGNTATFEGQSAPLAWFLAATIALSALGLGGLRLARRS